MSGETLRRAAEQIRRETPSGGDDFREFVRAVADWLDDEAVKWEADYESHWYNTARYWDKNNNKPMGDEVHAHFRATAAEFADGRHRKAAAVARAYLGESS